MTRCTLIASLLAALLVPIAANAQEAIPGDPADAVEPAVATDAAEPTDALDWEQFDDPDFDPANVPEPAAESAAADEPSDEEVMRAVMGESSDGLEATEPIETSSVTLEPSDAAPTLRSASGVVLGPRGVDDRGRAGRLHTVARGDTLWDLSAAYLGTPWVWPSVWIDNDDIDDPHLILPGDKIWITANEMRVVTEAEAASFVAAAETEPAPVEPAPAALPGDEPGLAMDPLAEDAAPVAALDGADEPSTLEAFPVAIPGASGEVAETGRSITVSSLESIGFVTAEELEASSTLVDSPVERTFLAQGDPVVIGLGEGDVEVGDEFTIFHVVEEVRDTETLRLLGHHIETLGWAEVKELTGDTAIAQIRTSYAEIARGTRIKPREPAPRSVVTRTTPDAIEGKIVFLPMERTIMADGGYVYLNRGEFHGVEVGSELEVFDAGAVVNEPTRRVDVQTPDRVVAKLIVVTVEPDSSVAFVLSADRELEVGDTVRASLPSLSAGR